MSNFEENLRIFDQFGIYKDIGNIINEYCAPVVMAKNTDCYGISRQCYFLFKSWAEVIPKINDIFFNTREQLAGILGIPTEHVPQTLTTEGLISHEEDLSPIISERFSDEKLVLKGLTHDYDRGVPFAYWTDVICQVLWTDPETLSNFELRFVHDG